MSEQISPQEAREMLAGEQRCRYLDVRSVSEFIQGHPPGACNVPLLQLDPESGMMKANDEFLKVIEANFGRDELIIIGCKDGGRSTRAARLLDEAGYTRCRIMRGGFAGSRDASGETVDVGWQGLGYPVDMENGEGVSYESLRKRVSSSAQHLAGNARISG